MEEENHNKYSKNIIHMIECWRKSAFNHKNKLYFKIYSNRFRTQFYRYMKHIQKRSTHCCTWCWILGRTSSGQPGTPAGGCWSCWWGVKALLPQRSVPTQQRPPAPRPSMSGSRREAPSRSRWRPDGCGCPVRRGSARRSWGCCRNPRDSPETERFPWLPWSWTYRD